jgi:hypothetical protein
LIFALRPKFETSRRSGLVFLLLVFSVVMLARLPLFCYDRFNPDEAFFLSSAMRMSADPVPYRSVDSGTSGPLNIYLMAVPALLGTSVSYLTSRLIGVGLVFGTLAFLWLAYREFLSRRMASVALMPALCFYAFAWDADMVHCSSEHLPVFLSSIAAWLLLADYRAGAEGPGWRGATAGLLAGAMVFAKLQALPIALTVVAIAALLAWRKPRRVATLGAIFGGAALIPVFFVAMFVYHGVLQEFWFSYFGRNSAYAARSGGSLARRWGTLVYLLRMRYTMGGHLMSLIPIWAIGIGGAATMVVSRYRAKIAVVWSELGETILLSAFSCALLLAGAVAVAVPANRFPHYLLFLVVPFGLCTATALAWTLKAREGAPGSARAAGMLIGLVAAACLVSTFVTVRATSSHASAWWRHFQPEGPMVETIKRHVRPQETLVVWGLHCELYIESGRRPGTRFADSALLLEATPYRDYFRQVFLSDFAKSNPPVFVDLAGPSSSEHAEPHETFAEFRAVVASNYRQVAEIDGARIFVRNSEDAANLRSEYR